MASGKWTLPNAVTSKKLRTWAKNMKLLAGPEVKLTPKMTITKNSRVNGRSSVRM